MNVLWVRYSCLAYPQCNYRDHNNSVVFRSSCYRICGTIDRGIDVEHLMNAAAEMTGVNLLTRHQQNIAASLAHRLEAARAANNTRLVELLEQEQRQLAAEYGAVHSSPALLEGLRHAWKLLKEVLTARDELRVRQWVDGNGIVWWHAQDPITGDRFCTHSDRELMEWIEKHHWND